VSHRRDPQAYYAVIEPRGHGGLFDDWRWTVYKVGGVSYEASGHTMTKKRAMKRARAAVPLLITVQERS
jgi:hypothetical protein